jgi:hypothetical protein
MVVVRWSCSHGRPGHGTPPSPSAWSLRPSFTVSVPMASVSTLMWMPRLTAGRPGWPTASRAGLGGRVGGVRGAYRLASAPHSPRARPDRRSRPERPEFRRDDDQGLLSVRARARTVVEAVDDRYPMRQNSPAVRSGGCDGDRLLRHRPAGWLCREAIGSSRRVSGGSPDPEPFPERDRDPAAFCWLAPDDGLAERDDLGLR